MRVWQRTLLTLLFSLIIAQVSMAQDDSTALPPDGNIVIVNSAFVRSGPSNDYIAVGALYGGDLVTPLNISADAAWVLIPYSRSTGWVQRSLVRWEDNTALDTLPILPADFTPTPRVAITNTPFIPTSTPQGSYINVEGAASAYVRAGPGRGYLRLGQLLPGEIIEAVARNADTSWIMIRFTEEELESEFGWLAFELVYWEELEDLETLPIITIDDLTPTVTFTPSQTPSMTASATSSPTITASPTLTNTAIPSATLTATLEPTATALATHTSTPIITDTETNTPEPSLSPTETITASATATNTPIPTNTPEPSPTATETNTVTPSLTPSETNTALPTATHTPIPTNTSEPSLTPSETNTLTPTIAPSETNTALPAATDTPIPTNTAESTVTPTETATVITAASIADTPTSSATVASTATDIFAIEATSVSVVVTQVIEPSPQAPFSNILNDSPRIGNNLALPIEALAGIVILLIVLGYVWFYWQGLSTVGRYQDGFIIETCPVCQRGDLHLDERPSRIFGIPSVRRTVRCDVCRSVLRETGTRRWRYAVDRIENPTMFDRFNGRQITDADLERLAKTPPVGARAKTSPEFVDNDIET